MAKSVSCPRCGGEIPADAPQGLCPNCALQAGFQTEGHTQTGAESAITSPWGENFVPLTPAELAPYFPDLEILELLGRGGMGVVYKARQKQLGRLAALKILSPKIGRDPAFAERFAREARSLAMLSHPHIVTVYSFGQTSLAPQGKEAEENPPLASEGKAAGGEGSLYYFLMELVDGVNLRQLLDTEKLAPEAALAIVPQICEALQYAHDKGVVHRDIKPENILLDKNGQVKIADFGLAKITGRESPDFSLSATNQVMGTPYYMAPEQTERPRDVDHRADIYSLGVVFYQMLTGELPLGRFAPPSKKVQIDVRLDEVVLRALEKEPGRRYQQASEIKTQIETITGWKEMDRDEQPVPSKSGKWRARLMPIGVRGGRKIVNWPVVAWLWPLVFLGYAFIFKANHTMVAGTSADALLMCFYMSALVTALILGVICTRSVEFLPRLDSARSEPPKGESADWNIDVFRTAGKAGGWRKAIKFSLGSLFLFLATAWAFLSHDIAALIHDPSTPLHWDKITAICIALALLITGLGIFCLKRSNWVRIVLGVTILLLLLLIVSLFSAMYGASKGMESMMRFLNPRTQAKTAKIDIAPQQAEPWRVGLPKGSIELTAISRPHLEPELWWKPDGSRFSGGPFENQGSFSVADESLRTFLFLVYLPDLNASITNYSVNLNGGTGGQSTPDLDGRPLYGYRMLYAALPKTAKTVDLVASVATGSWETIETYRPSNSNWYTSSNSKSVGGIDWSISASVPLEKSDGSIAFFVTHNRPDQETRILVIDDQGKEHAGSLSKSSRIGNADQKMVIFQNLSLKQIKEYRFQARPCHEVTFRNVALEPNFREIPDKPATDEKSFVTFRPAKERVLSTRDADDQGYLFFDLKNGKVSKPPFRLRPTSNPMTLVEYTPELRAWIDANSMDLLFHFSEERWRINAFMPSVFIAQPTEWKSIRAEKIRDSFAQFKDSLPFASNAYTSLVGGDEYLAGVNPCFAFRTRDKSLGVYQMNGVNSAGIRGVWIRYKFVEDATTGQPTPVFTKLSATKEQIKRVEMLLKTAPVTTGYPAEIFEPVPGMKGEYRLRPEVVMMQILPAEPSKVQFVSLGQAFYLPNGKRFYLQWDPIAAGTLHYYGPFDGEPTATLGLTKMVEEEKSKDRERADSAQLLQQGWHLLWERGQMEGSRRTYQRAVEIDPKNPNAWDGLGWANFNCGKFAEAKKAFEEAIRLSPGHLAALNGLGQSYFFEKNYEKAELYLLKAAPLGDAAWYGLTRLYLLRAQYAEAEKWAQKIVDSNPADKIAKQLLQAAKEEHISEEIRVIIEPSEIKTKNPPIKAEDAKVQFSPVIDRVVRDVQHTFTDCLIDLDTGKLFSLPGTLAILGKTDSKAASLEMQAWLRQHHVDAIGSIFRSEGTIHCDLMSEKYLGLFAEKVENDAWVKMSAEELSKSIERAISERGDNLIRVLRASANDNNTPMEPATYIFETRAGAKGIVQILGPAKPLEGVVGVKIRYRLLRKPVPAEATTLYDSIFKEVEKAAKALKPDDLDGVKNLPRQFEPQYKRLEEMLKGTVAEIPYAELKEMGKTWDPEMKSEKDPQKKKEKTQEMIDKSKNVESLLRGKNPPEKSAPSEKPAPPEKPVEPQGPKLIYEIEPKNSDSAGKKLAVDFQDILGQWEVVSVEGSGGRFMSLSDQSKPGDRLLIAHVDTPDGQRRRWLSEEIRRSWSLDDSLHLSPETNPPRLTYKARDGKRGHFEDTKNPPDYGIYRLKGDDLTILAGDPHDFRVDQGAEVMHPKLPDGSAWKPFVATWKITIPHYATEFRLEAGRRQILVNLRRVAAAGTAERPDSKTAEKPLAWQQTEPYVAPDFEGFFPEAKQDFSKTELEKHERGSAATRPIDRGDRRHRPGHPPRLRALDLG